MKQLAIKLIVFLAIVYVLLLGLDRYYTRYKTNHKNLCEKSDWVLNHHNESYDFAFIGNSRVINMVDVDTIEKKTGKKGINLGLIGANYAENYLLLDQFLKAGNTLKNLMIQVDMHSLKSSTLPYPFHNYNYMHLFSDTTVCNIYRDNNPAYKYFLWKYVPFTRYMEFSSKFVLYKMLKGGFDCDHSDVYDPNKGTEFLAPKTLDQPPGGYAYWSISPLDAAYLDRLITRAKKENIKVVLYTAPMYKPYYRYQLRLDDVLAQVKKLAAEKQVPYFNLSKGNELCYDKTQFNDNIHMNAEGVHKLSAALADSIKTHLQ